MRVAKLYGLLWAVAAFAITGLYLTDSFNTTTSIILGFFVSVLAGSGLLVVYPALMTERVAAGVSVVR
jgi:hypothetical protein